MSRKSKQTHNSNAWRCFSEAFANWHANPVSRRRFIQGMSAISAAMLLPINSSRAKAQSRTESLPQQAPWPTIAAVQEHLFPVEADSPGANDIHAASYLKNLLEDSAHDQDERSFILNGPNWLHDMSNKEYKKPLIQ